MKEFYESPLSSRYASEYMLRLFSPDKRYGTWRRLWVALARAEHRLGLPVTDEQVAQLEAHVDDEIDYAAVAEWEKKLRHDVMAHIHVYGESCPDAAGIIHLGSTSCYVTDNADIMIYRDALLHIRSELVNACCKVLIKRTTPSRFLFLFHPFLLCPLFSFFHKGCAIPLRLFSQGQRFFHAGMVQVLTLKQQALGV